MKGPKVPPPIPAPITPTMAEPSSSTSAQGSALSGAFSGFRFAPMLSAFAQGRGGRRSMIGGGQ